MWQEAQLSWREVELSESQRSSGGSPLPGDEPAAETGRGGGKRDLSSGVCSQYGAWGPKGDKPSSQLGQLHTSASDNSQEGKDTVQGKERYTKTLRLLLSHLGQGSPTPRPWTSRPQPVQNWAAQQEVSRVPLLPKAHITTFPCPMSMEKLSSMKSVPGAKKVGDHWFRGNKPMCPHTLRNHLRWASFPEEAEHFQRNELWLVTQTQQPSLAPFWTGWAWHIVRA